MKTIGFLSVAGLVMALATAAPTFAHGPQQAGQGMPGQGMMQGIPGQGTQGQQFIPGQGMMGQGMMQGIPGQGTQGQQFMPGQGMMGQGMMGQGMPGYGAAPLNRDLSVDDVRHMLGHRVEWHGGALQLGEVKALDDHVIVAEILDSDGKTVRRFQIDRHTGAMYPVPVY